jgi:hypothetical protein
VEALTALPGRIFRDSQDVRRGGSEMKKLTMLALAFLVFGGLSLASAKTITGVVSDSHCGAKHSTAGKGECVEHCVGGGASYVLVSNGKVYQLDSQDKFKGLGGKQVNVKGAVSGDSIKVSSVAEKTS